MPDRNAALRAEWRRATTARVGLERAGPALATQPVLAFRAAHARARDAVHTGLDEDALAAAFAPRGVIRVHSEARDREEYLRRPDLGRRLHPDFMAQLPGGPCEVAMICADGLSALAVQQQAPPFVAALAEELPGISICPIIVALRGRVALSDDVGEAMGARLAIIMIGERPGLSVADSMGVYITYGPRRGRRDMERNCISNIHGDGLSPRAAAAKTAWIVRTAMAMECTGVTLKDEQPMVLGEAETGLIAGV
ncbi:MAG: ethanolamine ammonia-lyase subunit EutC [Sphingobium sp.]